MTQFIKRELAIFLIVGLLTVIIDFLMYRGILYLKPFGLESVNLAKGFGFVGGTIFAYFANRYWTFNQQKSRAGSAERFIAIYLVGLFANIIVNHLCIIWLKSIFAAAEFGVTLAFMVATGVSASLNFLGMKFFVFTDHK